MLPTSTPNSTTCRVMPGNPGSGLGALMVTTPHCHHTVRMTKADLDTLIEEATRVRAHLGD